MQVKFFYSAGILSQQTIFNINAAVCNRFKQIYRTQKRRLPRPARSDYAHNFFFSNFKRHTFEYVQFSKRCTNIFGFNHAHKSSKTRCTIPQLFLQALIYFINFINRFFRRYEIIETEKRSVNNLCNFFKIFCINMQFRKRQQGKNVKYLPAKLIDCNR